MSSQPMHTTAFILSLIGGIVIILGSVVSLFWSYYGWPYHGTMGPWMMWGFGYGYGFMWLFSMAALVSGIIVLMGAIMLNARPVEHMAWGTIVLVFSLISLLGMGGFMIGALLGIAGGALALSYKSP